MKNFKIIIKTDQKNCPFKYVPYSLRTRPSCTANYFELCTEKNCPFKEEKK